MKGKGSASRKIGTARVGIAVARANFDIFPVFAGARGVETLHYFRNALVFPERLAMIRERNRDKTPPTQPTINPAKDQTVRELLPRRSGGVNNSLIAIGAAKSFKPTRGVKYRAVRMPIEKPWPAGIIERIEFVDAQLSVPMARPETGSVPSKLINVVRPPGLGAI